MSDREFLQRYANVREQPVPEWSRALGHWLVTCPVCGRDDVMLVEEHDGKRRIFFDTEQCYAAY